MRLTRQLTISLIYNLKHYLHEKGFTTEEGFVSQFPYVRILTKDQAYGTLVSPCIVVYPATAFDEELQIGGGYWVKTLYLFDIYADSDAQMLELTDIVRQFAETNTHIYGYDVAQPSYQVFDGIVRDYYVGDSPAEVATVYFENRSITFFDRMDTVGESTAHVAQLSTVAAVPNV
jgi:hypothetical protein